MDKGLGRQIGGWSDGMDRDRGWNDWIDRQIHNWLDR